MSPEADHNMKGETKVRLNVQNDSNVALARAINCKFEWTGESLWAQAILKHDEYILKLTEADSMLYAALQCCCEMNPRTKSPFAVAKIERRVKEIQDPSFQQVDKWEQVDYVFSDIDWAILCTPNPPRTDQQIGWSSWIDDMFADEINELGYACASD